MKDRQLRIPEGERGRITGAEAAFLVALLLFSLALRIGYHYEMRGHPLAERLHLDEQFHDRWAKAIAAGDVMGEGVFFRAPLYPYLLGVSYRLFGPDPDIPRLVQHVLGIFLVLLIYLLTRQLFGVWAAVAASLLGALYSVMISFEGRLLFDFPLAFLVLLWFVLVAFSPPTPSWSRYAFIGLLFGLICIMRPTFVALAPLLLGLFTWNHLRGRLEAPRMAAVLIITFLLPILLVTARNWIVGGDAVLIAAQGGINYYIGNNPQSDGMTSSVPEAGGVAWENRTVQHLAEKALGYPLRPSEVSAYWYGKAWTFAREDPVNFLRLFLKKFYLFWSRIEIANNQSYYTFERASGILGALPVGFWLVGPLGLAGIAIGWREPRARMLILFMLAYALVTAAFFVCDRFRLPVIPILCVFSGLLLSTVASTISQRQWKTFGLIGLLTGFGALLVNTNLAGLRPDMVQQEDEVKAMAALGAGDLQVAAELFDQVALSDPENRSARINQGIALWRMGKLEDAAGAFRLGIAGEPYLAQLNLAQLYFNLNMPDSVHLYAIRSIAARPFAPGGYIIAAKNHLVQQHPREAEAILLKGAEACREDFVYGEYLLAGIYLQEGRLVPADSTYRTVLRKTERTRQPDYALEEEKTRYGEDLATLRAKSMHAIGRVFATRGHLDSSVVYLRSAAQLLPTKGDVWADWGVCLLRLDRLAEADTVMQRAVTLSAGNPAVWFNYATVLAKRGEIVRARRAIAQALALKPDFEEALQLREALSANTRR